MADLAIGHWLGVDNIWHGTMQGRYIHLKDVLTLLKISDLHPNARRDAACLPESASKRNRDGTVTTEARKAWGDCVGDGSATEVAGLKRYASRDLACGSPGLDGRGQ